MNITIAGYGFVGKAMEAYLQDTDATVRIVDPKLSKTNVRPTHPDGIVICVNTPALPDWSCDMSNVLNVIDDTPFTTPILIKSTISVEGWSEICRAYPRHSVSFSPEFLRAETAIEDMLAANTVYIGGGDIYFWDKLLQRKNKQITIKVAHPRELILAKYFRNSFLATKVSFFNEIHDLCESIGVDYKNVSSLVTDDTRIGDSHTRVKSERGFGGHCFPKDTQAILKTANNYGISLSVINQAVHYNNYIRRKGDT